MRIHGSLRGGKRIAAAALVLAIGLAGAALPVALQSAEAVVPSASDSAATSPSAQSLDFPRLAMWWPAPWEQSLADIARYDWVAMESIDGWAIPELKAHNPDVVMLVATNPCELSFEHMSGASPQWLLTQAGSTLTAPVGDGVTALPVAEGTGRFEVGDYVVIDEEIVKVTAVGGSSLSVSRGVAPTVPAPHAAGVRVAAAIEYWPDSLVFDVTSGCPAVDVGYGPETWVEWIARAGDELLDTADWDGLILDRCNGDVSFLVSMGYARSIDIERSDTVVSDYAAIDGTWGAGIREYVQTLRNTVGDDVVLLPNGGAPHYDLFNGSVFENYPTEQTSEWGRGNWYASTFGPTTFGSVDEWATSAQDPNLTTLESFEDEYLRLTQMPDPPNYQKMRFGLATALMSDAHYSYVVSTLKHGSGGLTWFDEYDNAGEGKGYLGQPIGDARSAVQELTTTDLIGGNGAFASADQFAAWVTWAAGGYAATTVLEDGAAKATVTASAGDKGGVTFDHPVAIGSTGHHRVSFRARASKPLEIQVNVMQTHSPWALRFPNNIVELTTEWQTFEIPGDVSAVDAECALQFGVGGTEATVWIDDAEFRSSGGGEAFRRDYEGGVALVNPSGAPVTIELGEAFRKIDGTQDRAVNDGSLVTEVTLPPRDGIVLLREIPLGLPDGRVDYVSLEGGNRYTTAVRVSQEAFPDGAETVVIATGRDWPDALGGAALAGVYDAPILLVDKDTLSEGVVAEIERLGATKAIILGGPAVVAPRVESELRDAGITWIARHGGRNRHRTAELVAEATIRKLGAAWDGTVLVATSMDFPDALAGSPLAASGGWPVYLADPEEDPAALVDELQSQGASRAILLGGPEVVPAGYADALGSTLGNVVRLGGANRYSTAVDIAEFGTSELGLGWDGVAITTGEDFPDALSGAMLCAKRGSVLALTERQTLSDEPAAVLEANRERVGTVYFVGGTGAVSMSARYMVAAVLE